MKIMTIEGKKVRHSEFVAGYDGGSVNRANMQKYLLKMLFPSTRDEEGVLFCGSGIETYSEDENGGKVVATLVSGESISGSILLACDGIHSRCRAVMHGGYDSHQDWETNAQTMNAKDPLHFCKAMVYWGKTAVPKGSDLEKAFSATQRSSGKNSRHCTNFVFGLATSRAPAALFVVPSHNGTVLNWAITIRSETERLSGANDGKDLTRRGGGPLTEDEKNRLFDFGSHGRHSKSVVRGVKDFPLLEKLIEMTPAQDITEAGLFDRENLDLPYSSEKKLVALLGDAAHPQTPFLGQGVNMAITDAYVYATNIAVALQSNKKSLPEVISDCDTDLRHKQANSVIKAARTLCNISISTNPMVCSTMWMYGRFAPVKEFMNQINKTDKSNRNYLQNLDQNHCTPKEQEAMR